MASSPLNAYDAVRGFARTWFDVDNFLDVAGEGNLPRDTGFLLASNHASFADPPVIAAAVPARIQIYFFARKTLFKGWFGSLISTLHAIPVDRDADGDLAAFRRVFEILKAGHPLLVFPEGTRSADGSIGQAEKGVGLIACRAGVPIVPTRVFGTRETWGREQKRPRLHQPLAVTFGHPFDVKTIDPGKKSSERYAIVANRTLDAIRELRPPPRWKTAAKG